MRRGMILFVVSIAVAIIAAGSLALLSLLTTEYEATVFRGDEIQAGQLVQSGAEQIAVMVSTPETPPEISDDAITNSLSPETQPAFSTIATSASSNPLYDNPAMFRGAEVFPAGTSRSTRGAGRFAVFSPRIEQDRHKGIRFGLVNESSRLHLGMVLQWEYESPGQGAKSLLKLPGMTPTMADAILDWLDADKQARPSGAELDYYEQTGVPYRPRNDIPVALEELLLVRDVSRPLLFGTDESFSYGAKMNDLQRLQAALNEQNDLLFQPIETDNTVAGSAPPEQEESFAPPMQSEQLPWCFLLTTLSAEKLVDPHGTAKIDLNDSNLEFLEEQLRQYLDEESVAFIIAWRKTNKTITDPLDLLDAAVAGAETEKELNSPFSLGNSAAEAKFLTLLDYATTSSSVVLTGRINVNEAPRVVLEAVPGLTAAMVQRILARRTATGEKAQGRFRHSVWLLSEKIVDKETMKKLLPYLTTGGDVYRAQIAGFFDGQGTVSRAEVVIDATVKPPRQVFSKDLTMFGSGFE
jgi:DNA uptake protein ComE-like DNA-binding protein